MFGYFLQRHPINTLTLPYGTSPELWKKWGRQQPPCIIASHFTMCVFVWVFERGSLATPFLPSKMKCLFHTAGEILGAPYESVGTLVRQFWYLLVSGSATRMALLLPRRSPRQAPHLRVGGIGRQASTICEGRGGMSPLINGGFGITFNLLNASPPFPGMEADCFCCNVELKRI